MKKIIAYTGTHGTEKTIKIRKIKWKKYFLEFYKAFYERHKIDILQYQNLRKHFNKMVKAVLGKDYYNMGMDVYECDRITCEDIIKKTKPKGFFHRLFNK